MHDFPCLVRVLAVAAVLLALPLPGTAQLRMSIIPSGEPHSSRAQLAYDALPDTQIGYGRNDIAGAWLADATTRYAHGILGDYVDAGSLSVRLRDGRVLTYQLPDDSVFEDLKPRVYDLDGDGRDEVLLVHSRQADGASLMALGVRGNALVPLAETPALGARFSWLNPVGVADVDGDGRPEVLVGQRPHSSGTLVVYRYRDGSFVETQRLPGVSNHQVGSRENGLHALLDMNGDGLPELIVPSSDRTALRAISFSHDGIPLEFTRIQLPSPAAGDFEVEDPHTLVVPLEDGRRVRITWP